MLASSLLTAEQLEQACETLQPTYQGPDDDERLSNKLVATGMLTWYQAEQLKAGRTKLTLGPYVITDWIAQGGMGQVFKGVHQLMGREVAVKVLPQSRSTPEAIENFTREIRTQAKLDHQNLVRAFDAGHDGNVYFLVTEYVPGTDLRRLLRSRGPLTMQQAAAIIIQVAKALAEAHNQDLIHRDIKPGNILVTPDGRAKLSDLGLAGSLDPDDDDPRAGRIVGTADYIPPETIKSPGDATAVSDIYSLGCTLYYAVTGKVPYPGGTVRNKCRRHCDATPWHPRRFNSNVTEDFVDIIADMMEKDPLRRIQNAMEVATRLEPFSGEDTTIPTEHLARSPWQPPPVPSSGDSAEKQMHDTDDWSNEENDSQHDDSSSGAANGSDTQRTGSQRTVPMLDWQDQPVSVPPLPVDRSAVRSAVLFALAVAVPISMLAGALLASMFWLSVSR